MVRQFAPGNQKQSICINGDIGTVLETSLARSDRIGRADMHRYLESLAWMCKMQRGLSALLYVFLDRVRDRNGADIYKTKSGFYPLQKNKETVIIKFKAEN